MAVGDYFLKLDGIEGESADDKHKGTIEVESFSWGVANMGTGGTHTGGGAGKSTFQDIHFTAPVSKASQKLFLACATGQHLKEGTLNVRKAGGKQDDFYIIKMNDVFISSYQGGGSAHGGVLPTDQFSLNFSKIEFTYKVQQKDGSMGSGTPVGYDVAANKKI